jgi:HPt (histidine-containing phosphotransfer) domain-containing protein
MSSAKPTKPDVVTYGDHEIMTPDTSKLRKTMRAAIPGEPDPVERAEQALAAISGDFGNWMEDECDRLDRARQKAKEKGLTDQTREELFLSAHDLKGDSATLGFPEVAPAAESLCRLLEYTPDLRKIPMAIIDQHVDAVRAIIREYGREDVGEIAKALSGKLRSVTDEFLVKENQDRPDILRIVQGPSLVPNESF